MHSVKVKIGSSGERLGIQRLSRSTGSQDTAVIGSTAAVIVGRFCHNPASRVRYLVIRGAAPRQLRVLSPTGQKGRT